MRIFSDEKLLSVLRTISIDTAITKEEISALTGLEESAINGYKRFTRMDEDTKTF